MPRTADGVDRLTLQEQDDMIFKKVRTYALYGVTALLSLMLLFGSWFTVDQTELANVRRMGVVQYAVPLTPGFHFKAPLIDSVDKIRVTLQTIHIPPFDVLTVDNQKVTIEENFNFTVAPSSVHKVLYEVGDSGYEGIETQIIPVAHDRTARIFASQNMVTVNANREAIQEQVEKSIHSTVETLFGITPHSLQIISIKPSENFMHSIDEATMAKNQAIAAENQLRTKQFEAQQVAATAKGAADAAIEQARGVAQSTILVADANKTRLVKEGEGLQSNLQAQIAPFGGGAQYVSYLEAKAKLNWNGSLPTTMVPGGAVPFLSLK